MDKFIVPVISTMKYVTEILIEAENEVDAAALAVARVGEGWETTVDNFEPYEIQADTDASSTRSVSDAEAEEFLAEQKEIIDGNYQDFYSKVTDIVEDILNNRKTTE